MFSLFSEPVFLHLLCQNFVVVDVVGVGVVDGDGDVVGVVGGKDGDLKLHKFESV